MKTLIMLIMLLPLTAHAFKNEPDGFRGINWGDDQVLHAEQLEKTDDDGNYSTYIRKDESLKLGGADLSRITYGYKDNRFQMVIIRTERGSSARAFIDAFTEQFGHGKKPNRYIDKYIWDGSKAKILVECNSVRDTCSATIMSTQGYKDHIAESKKQAKEAAADF